MPPGFACPVLALLVSAAACRADADPVAQGPERDEEEVFCTVPARDLASVLVPEAIRALEDPPLVPPEHPEAAYVDSDERVIGLLLEGAPVAVPLNLIRQHEVVNLSRGEERIAATYCPLTGSSIVFDRTPIGGGALGVSGLLHANNLVLYDREDPASFFTQMRRGAAVCGPDARSGVSLRVIGSIELRWDAWRRLHPGTLVVSNDPAPDVDRGSYDVNVYENYERIDNPFIRIPMDLDPRRPPKERVLGVPAGGDGGPSFPFEELRRSERRAISTLSGTTVVFWDRTAEAAVAFDTELDGMRLTFQTTADGYRDDQTGSDWRLDGLAVSGPLEDRRLDQIPDAFVAFWFAWAAFFPETVVWEDRGG